MQWSTCSKLNAQKSFCSYTLINPVSLSGIIYNKWLITLLCHMLYRKLKAANQTSVPGYVFSQPRFQLVLNLWLYWRSLHVPPESVFLLFSLQKCSEESLQCLHRKAFKMKSLFNLQLLFAVTVVLLEWDWEPVTTHIAKGDSTKTFMPFNNIKRATNKDAPKAIS